MAQPATQTPPPSYGTNPAMRGETRVVGAERTGSQDDHGKTLQQRADEAAAEARAKIEQLTEESSEAARAEARAAEGRARQLAAELQSHAQQFTDQAVDRVKSTAENAIEQQRDRAAGFVGATERAVNAAARSLDEDGYGWLAGYVRYASSTLHSVNEEVEGFRPQRFTGEAERVAKRNPLITYGALAVAGFALVTLMSNDKR